MHLDLDARSDRDERRRVEVVGVVLDDRAVEAALEEHLGTGHGLTRLLLLLRLLALHPSARAPEHEDEEEQQQDDESVLLEEEGEIHEAGCTFRVRHAVAALPGKREGGESLQRL